MCWFCVYVCTFWLGQTTRNVLISKSISRIPLRWTMQCCGLNECIRFGTKALASSKNYRYNGVNQCINIIVCVSFVSVGPRENEARVAIHVSNGLGFEFLGARILLWKIARNQPKTMSCPFVSSSSFGQASKCVCVCVCTRINKDCVSLEQHWFLYVFIVFEKDKRQTVETHHLSNWSECQNWKHQVGQGNHWCPSLSLCHPGFGNDFAHWRFEFSLPSFVCLMMWDN